MISAFLKKWGCNVHFLRIAGNREKEVREMIERNISDYDIVLTSGGVSVRKRDYVTKVLSEMGELLLYRLSRDQKNPW